MYNVPMGCLQLAAAVLVTPLAACSLLIDTDVGVRDPGDQDGPMNALNSHNNGKYAMYVTVSQPNHGPTYNIKPGENLNPVKTLRMRYDAWIKAHPTFKR